MRISPISLNSSVNANQTSLSKCRKPCGSVSNSLNYNDTFEKSEKSNSSQKQNLSFGWIPLLDRRRIKNAIGERYYRPLLDSTYFDVEYKRGFSGMVHVIHVHPENLSDSPSAKKAINKIQKTFIENHSDRFSMKNFNKIGFVSHGSKDLIMMSTLAKKLKPYEKDEYDDDIGGRSDGYDEIFDHDAYFT